MGSTENELIAGSTRDEGGATYRSVDPSTAESFGPAFHDATDAEVDRAVAAAEAAFTVTRTADGSVLAAVLEAIAGGLEGLGDELVDLAARETGLGSTRILGERGRTCGQLRAFAEVAREGSHRDIRIDPADPSATPPRAELRRMQIALGPVAVFGASNFPLAFSIPGGDTASALAAGCPVVAKVHPSHPGTSELCGRVIAEAVQRVGLPAGMFALLHGRDVRVSQRLVLSSGIKAVGFTGSERAGRALFDLGAGRDEPIPVYAEMGSLNPQFVTARALAERGGDIARGLVASVALGTGQFCTKPGLVFLPEGPEARAFEAEVVAAAGGTDAGTLLNEGIWTSLRERLDRTVRGADVEVLVDGQSLDTGFGVGITVLATSLASFLASPELSEEHFGPVTVLVRVDPSEDLATVASNLPGALSASLHATEEDADEVAGLLVELTRIAGRVVWNEFPTGVAVVPAMHHGGPYPAATFAAHTSVGTAAVRRFVRPVVYQNLPPSLLPPPLRDASVSGA